MRLREIEHKTDYNFLLRFENGEFSITDLESLISKYVKPQELETAKINQEWGCLEFNNGKVDIEPKTLYRYVKEHKI